MLVLIVYDIPDNKRRQKLATFLEGHGRRVQYSVFECFISLAEMKKLHEKVKRQVKPAEDNVRFYLDRRRQSAQSVDHWQFPTRTAAPSLHRLTSSGPILL